MITRLEVAKYAGVSPATVSRVVNKVGYVTDEKRARVQQAIRELGYRPNNIARNLAANRSNQMAVLLEDLRNPYYMEMIDYMVNEAKANGYMLSIFAVKDGEMEDVLNDLISNRVSGIVNLTLYGCGEEKLKEMDSLGIKTVNFNETSRVVIDYEPTVRDYLQLLRERGYRRLGFLAGMPEERIAGDKRLQSYLKYRAEFGFAEDDRLIVYGNYPHKEAYANGYDSAVKLLEQASGVDSLLCMNDMTAFGAVCALQEHKIRIPEEVAVIGCDNIAFSQFLHPSLCSIDVDKEDMCKRYVRSLLGLIDGAPEQVIAIPTRMVVRDSIG